MTVKTVYIPIILLPNILWHYFDAAFLLEPLKSTAAYSVIDVNYEVKLTIQKLAIQPSSSLIIINLTPTNRIPFSPIMFLLFYIHELSTSYLTRFPFKMSASAIYLSQHDLHDFSTSNIFVHTRPVYYNTHMSHSTFMFQVSTINSNLRYSE